MVRHIIRKNGGDPASVGTGPVPSARVRRDPETSSDWGRGQDSDWPELLSVACLTLRKTPEDVIPAISVTLSLTGRPDEARAIATLSRRLAAKHGLQETMALEGRHVTVRFSRRADGDQTPGTR